MPTLSVAIITKNEEDRLPSVLEAIKDLADEIVVVDSGSTDKTVEIAKAYGAKVFVEEWKGYGKQKQSAFEKTTGDWVLFLDADEVPDQRLKNEIREIVKKGSPEVNGYFLKRRAVYLGKPLKFLWANEWLLRLVNRKANPRWDGDIHETLIVKGKTDKITRGELLHYTYRNLFEHFQKSLLYAKLSAEDYFKKGKKPSLLKLLLNPLWAFLKVYLLKLGFLEGYRGFFIAVSYSFNAFMKYALLGEFYRREKTERNNR